MFFFEICRGVGLSPPNEPTGENLLYLKSIFAFKATLIGWGQAHTPPVIFR